MNGRVRSLDLLQRPAAGRFKSQSYRVTRMLILVSTCFLLLNAPAHICTIGLKIYTLKLPLALSDTNEIFTNTHDSYKQRNESSSTISNSIDVGYTTRKTLNTQVTVQNIRWMEYFYIVIVITQHISYASYSINFFLYSFCGMKFRRELLRCMSTQRRQLPTSRSITV